MNRIVNALTYMGMFIVMGMAILTGLDVVGRYFFKTPLKGTFELTEALLSSIVAFGIAATTAADEHITVDAFLVKLRPAGQRILKLFANSIGVCVFAVLVWQGIKSGIESIGAREQTDLHVPIFLFRFVLVLGFFLSFTLLIRRIVNLFRSKED